MNRQKKGPTPKAPQNQKKPRLLEAKAPKEKKKKITFDEAIKEEHERFIEYCKKIALDSRLGMWRYPEIKKQIQEKYEIVKIGDLYLRQVMIKPYLQVLAQKETQTSKKKS